MYETFKVLVTSTYSTMHGAGVYTLVLEFASKEAGDTATAKINAQTPGWSLRQTALRLYE